MNTKRLALLGSSIVLGALSIQPAMAVSIGVGLAVPAPVYVAPASVYVAAPPAPVVYAQPVVATPMIEPAFGIAIGWHAGRYWDGRRWWGRQEWAARHRW